MLSSGWRGTISNFAIYLDVPIPADWHTKPGLNVACGLSPPLGPFLLAALTSPRPDASKGKA
jgi:hypothetical protein